MASKTNSPPLFFPFLVLAFVFFFFAVCRAESEAEDESPFTYESGTGRGPENWGLINPEWKVCDNGEMQSPIDLLHRRVQVASHLGKLKRDYKPAPATIKNRGHDITVKWKGYAGKISINGTYYNLAQCHWHSPSEHTINGSRYNLELHIVHLSSKGEIAVIGILYKFGRPDRFLTKLLHHIRAFGKEEKRKGHTSSSGHEERYLGVLNPGEIQFGSRKYYRYIGSLTVPPCSEGVVWTISQKVRTVSREQVRALRVAVHDGFEANARPLQKSDGRNIWMYRPRVNRGSP